MRLGIFHPAFQAMGGAEILIAAQAQFYRAQGVDPEIVTMGFDAARWGSRLEGIPIHAVRRRQWSDILHGWSRISKLQRRGERATRALRSYDLVIAYNFPANAMLGAAPIQARKVWQCNEPPRGIYRREANPVLTARVEATAGRGPEEASLAFARNLQDYEARVARPGGERARLDYDRQGSAGLDLIYAISEFSRDNARRIYGRCRDEVIYPMIRFPEGIPPRSGLDRTVRRILVHSRLEALKNIDTVIRGFRRFQSASPVPCELHLVGEGPFRDRLEALAASLCPAGTVRFHGYLSEDALREVYAACDVLALLTLDEPFGLVYPEAAARGLLLVGPDHGGPLEILDGGRLGWTVDAFSPEALAEALAEIWSLDDAEVDRRRAAADRACRARYGAETIGPQLMALLTGA